MKPLPAIDGAPRLVVTLTANPSLDRTAELPELVPGGVLRMGASRLDAGGKGVNVARALHAAGVGVRAVLPIGGQSGEELLRLLSAEGISVDAVRIDEPIRSNLTLVEPGGRTTKLNEPGPDLSTTAATLAASVMRAALHADWVVLAGSLPPGLGSDFYADLVVALQDGGLKVAVDADGPILEAVLRAGPDLVKPNAEELAAATGIDVSDPYSARAAIEVLQGLGARNVLASLGDQGAVLVDETGTHHASGPAVLPRSTVGAGDATLAGFLAAGAHGPAALVRAVAYGTAAVQLSGTQMPTPGDADESAVVLTTLATERSLP
jgi:1-phosphofructokinase